MAEGDIPRRVTPATRLSPEEVATRGFASSFRGVSESEVRSFLRRVADEMAYTRDRERELEDRISNLEAQLRNPAPLTEQQLLDSLGEETARVLRSAQEAAEDIRSRAQERATLLVDHAEAEATRLTEEATALHEERVRTGDETAAEAVRVAEERVAHLRATIDTVVAAETARATTEAEAEIDGARTTGREMVAEARAVRERILADLARRRTAMQQQIDELRQGRERLLGAYRVVKNTLTEATEALSKVEAPTGAPLPLPADTPDAAEIERLLADDQDAMAPSVEPAPSPTQPVPVAVGAQEPHVEPPASLADTKAAALVAPVSEMPEPDETGPHETGPHEAEPETSGSEAPAPRDVNALFAKIRAARSDAVDDAREVLAETATAVVASKVDDAARAPSKIGATTETGADAIAARDAALAPIERDLLKLAKRLLQDEQNELLDAMRKVKGRLSREKVLPALDVHVEAWSERMALAIDAAYSAGSGGAVDPALELSRELAGQFVEPLRERIATTIESAASNGGDDEAERDEAEIAQRIGARYREWKSQDLEGAIGDLVTSAYARGVVDAAPEGAVLEWVTVIGGCCPDCDDNTLEPTTRGKPFPTGQLLPPAHPGCRCLVAAVQIVTGESVAGGVSPIHAVSS